MTDLPRDARGNAQRLSQYQLAFAGVQARLSKISIRETKASGRIVLPAKEFVKIECQWESAQLELYRQVRKDLRAVIFQDGKLIEEEQEWILKRLLRLVQIASNPTLVDESYHYEPGKFAPLYDLLSDIARREEKAIVFTTFNANADWLTKKLKAFGTLCLSGSMPMDRRNDAVKWFLENPQDRVLVATTGAAKEGLTLTAANHVIFFDRSYSLDDYLQAQDRIHRVSQQKTSYVYTLVMRDSIDEWIEALVEQKHLAAQLTLGDIDQSTYARKASFEFLDILDAILHV
jgi:SNF2 family DNA or RNA helicase